MNITVAHVEITGEKIVNETFKKAVYQIVEFDVKFLKVYRVSFYTCT